MDRDNALHTARELFEPALWALLNELEKATLADLARVQHMDLVNSRAIGSVLNGALPAAAAAVELEDRGLEVSYVKDGHCNKLSGTITFEGEERNVSFELHLSGPKGGTSKSSHQYAKCDFQVCDIEEQSSLFPYDVEAPKDLLFFVACHLSGTGASIARAFIKFADGIDQRMLETHRPLTDARIEREATTKTDQRVGAKLKLKESKRKEKENGSTTNQWRDAAPGSK
ncbi:hypothetical protein [Limimaricola sp. AA108-03]|uniref:hypothetical protein n=1 Tax=Limimaricola sp. AA108-03 TaxID=3425945 RepID=UPI003D776A5F